MNKSIFLTGGAGFIGSHLTERLVSEGYSVHIYDNLQRNAIQYADILHHPQVRFTQGDILDKDLLQRAMQGADVVIHLAAIAGVSNYYKYPAQTLKVNLIGTYHVLEAMVQLGIRHIFDMSTSETFGTEAVEVDENSYHCIGPAQDRRWSYAGSKIGGEQLIFRYAEEFGWRATIIRPFNIYGPRQVGEGAIANFCKNIIEGKNLRVEGSGMAIRSWCYITDFIEALMLILNNQHEGPEAFNVGNPWAVASTLSLGEEVIRVACRIFGDTISSRIEFVKMDYTEIKVRYPKVDKIARMYGWQPKVNLHDGICHTLKWFADHHKKI